MVVRGSARGPQAPDGNSVQTLRQARLPRAGCVSEMHGDLASVLGDAQIQQQAGDTAVDQQFFATVDGFGRLARDLNDEAREA